ncbi:MAG: cytochrome c3 family protein [Calditrichaeota bacterium]|nr:cytochrome c3 family protein [Calditrichota bacterium]
MRRVSALAVVFLAWSLGSYEGTAWAQRLNNPHDFLGTSSGFNVNNCAVCHTAGMAGKKRGNPALRSSEDVAGFTPYASSTLDAEVGQPDGPSKLCLSCHDGTVATDNVGGIALSVSFSSDKAILKRDLTDDHPVSFVYDANLAAKDGGLADPTTTESGLGGTIDHDLLVDGKVECTSCHDVHSNLGTGALLRKPNNQSSLCLTCHLK